MQPSAAGRLLSDDICDGNQSVILDGRHFISFSCLVVFSSTLILEAIKFWFLAILTVSDIDFLSQLGLKFRPVIG